MISSDYNKLVATMKGEAQVGCGSIEFDKQMQKAADKYIHEQVNSMASTVAKNVLDSAWKTATSGPGFE